MKKRVLFLSGILFLSSLVFCIDQKDTVAVKKIKTPPSIDGVLDEEIWKDAPTVDDFVQFEPNKGQPSSFKTIAKILYDDECIYFGFILYDPEPEKMVIGTNTRDGLHGDDNVTVNIDTFHDKRSAYYFRTNVLGGQHDGRNSDNGLVADTKWDGIWKCASSRIPEGWSAEMAIPFTTIKYLPGKNQTWGLKFGRYVQRNFEKDFWSQPLEDEYRKVSTYGELTGLDLEQSHLKVEIIPHVISTLQKGKKTNFEGGVDASYALSQNFSSHLTVNPDFATVEADREQVNLTRFELSLPEKRNFFLEGDVTYQQTLRLFYSRRISDIYAGAKIYGKAGEYEISFLSAQAKKNNGETSSNFSVVRLKKDILQSSNMGFLAANKLVNGRYHGAFGLDAGLNLSKTFSFLGQVAYSYGKGNKSDLAFFLWPNYDLSTFHAHLRYTYLGQYFGDNTNAVGFIQDDNRSELDSTISKIFWLKKLGMERLEYSSYYDIYWGIDKTLRSWEVRQGLTLDLQNKLNFRAIHKQEYKLYEKEFRNHSSIFSVGYNTREFESAVLSYEFGKNFGSDFTLWGANFAKKITQTSSLEYEISKLSYAPDPMNQSTWIHVINAIQYFTNDLFVKLFYQINSSIDKHNLQLVFVYRFQPPFGLIQLAYQKGSGKFGEVGSQGNTLFLKLAYVF